MSSHTQTADEHNAISLELTRNKDIVVIAMDAGNEIDDEIAAYLLMNHYKRGHTVFFAQVPGAITDGNSTHAMNRVERMREVFPDQFGSKDIWSPTLLDEDYCGEPSSFVLCLLEDLLFVVRDKKIQVKWFLQIAPLWGFSFLEFVNLEIETRIVMGDLENPEKSINCTKAIPKGESGDELRAEYYNQQETFNKITKITVCIPTQFARQVPTPMAFIMKLPTTMSEPLLDTAFRQFVGRPDPKLPWAEDISIANHATIMKMLSKDKMYEILSQPTEQRLVDMVIAFLGEENDCDKGSSGAFYPLRLGQIATAVEHITGVKYKQMPTCDFPTQFQYNAEVDSLEDSYTARKNWMNYIAKNNCDLTPFYDGLTVLYMLEQERRDFVKVPDTSMPSIERCKEMIMSL